MVAMGPLGPFGAHGVHGAHGPRAHRVHAGGRPAGGPAGVRPPAAVGAQYRKVPLNKK